ncbi:alginate export family protein [Terriglobus roseus]|uniref:Alginate export n=1 Tax=Terriglobus roseus TaxID=392734 RepID=A0A1G7JFZ3_9BACT|nr:alginate export family protein [Terriglobus roseus]SDF23409.1 Alginate export [Terriglobus roseus]
MKNSLFVLALASSAPLLSAQTSSPATGGPTVSVSIRQRTNATQWFAATPTSEVYGHQDSLLRLSLAQRIHNVDYMLDLGQSAELALPTDAVSPVAAQGQLGLGGTYYAANSNNAYPAAASFRQGYLRYHFHNDFDTVRVGRFEFFDGQEGTSKDTSVRWLQTNRVAQRLVGNFGFSNGQRSFDGIDVKLGNHAWDVTAMAGRATQGVFNMNANPELNVDIQYASYSHSVGQHAVLRGFGLGYHDGRTGITKTDNRSATAKASDHANIRIGTYGGDFVAAIPAGKTVVDFMVWGAGQSGHWGLLDHSAGAIAIEGGLRLNTVPSMPWVRGGYFRSTGDNNPADGKHNTFFQVLPTPRVYARDPFYNLMNSTDSFVQMVDTPGKKVEIRSDLHFLQLTSNQDLWYQGGGAFDSKVFGYTGRPSNGHNSFSSLFDISTDYAVTPRVSLTAYYAHAYGKAVIAGTYPRMHDSNYGYMELNYKFQKHL